MGQLVSILERKCPSSLEKKGTDELEINVDAIDGSTFQKVNELIISALPKNASIPIEELSKKKKQRV